MSAKARIIAAVWIALAWLQTQAAAGQMATVDIEIVLAVDASGSVDKHELQLQLKGIAAAFRDKTVQYAIGQGRMRRIAVAMLIWSDAAFSKFPSKWHIVASGEDAERFATAVEGFHELTAGVYSIGGGGTGLGDGLAYALKMIEDNGIEASRRIVDISGDGIETQAWNDGAIMLPEARSRAIAGSVTVNGLAITPDDPGLAGWYRRNVAVGAGSFVMEAVSFEDFRQAIRQKLLREFSPAAVRQNTGPAR
ncbi:MAG: DUF1194 domain-containing protein [Aestuariivirgaceae bacterium]